MGLTIHYRGHFNWQSSLPELIAEVKSIAEVNQWHYTIFNEKFPNLPEENELIKNELYGLIVSLPECEPVFLCFASDRRLANPVWLDLASQGQLEDEELLYLVFTKTQYAGVEAHKKIIHLLKYLSHKYFDEFKVSDEGQYWETGDEILLNEQFNKYNQYLSSFTTQIGSMSTQADESPDELVNRIVQLLKNNPNFKGLGE